MITGLLDGMVMQRNKADAAEITLYSDEILNTIEVFGPNGTFVIKPSFLGNKLYKLEGIPTGGPYTLNVNGQGFSEIYVGDLWILAGQSNMQGVGRLREKDLSYKGDDEIRAFLSNGKWIRAKHPLHYTWVENLKICSEKITDTLPSGKYQGVGMGIKFAECLKEKTGVPQGLICVACGGSPLKMWLKSNAENLGESSLYSAMEESFIMNGSAAAGMLWFQGCADAFDGDSDVFLQRNIEFFSDVRRDFGIFPIIQFQIGRVIHPDLGELSYNWTKIREIQRSLHENVEMLYTVSSIDKGLDDLIHLNSDSLEELGEAAAEEMLKLKAGKAKPQEIKGITLSEDGHSKKAIIRVEFKNLSGKLCSEGRPFGFTVCDKPYENENNAVFDIKLESNTAVLYLWLSAEEVCGRYLSYGLGLNPYCNIKDSAGKSLLCFGPIEIKGAMKNA